VGQTACIEARLKAHNSGVCFSTRNRGPWKILFFESCETRSDAMRMEKYLKTGKGRDYIRYVVESAAAD